MRKKSKARGSQFKLPPAQDSTSPYEVGYGRPPVYSRFQSGRSGNPRGRPKGQINLENELKNELNRLITIREGDRTRRLKKGIAWLVRTVNGALNNDPKANVTLVALIRTLILGHEPQEAAEAPLTTNDAALLADFRQRYGGLDDHGNRDADAGSPQTSDTQRRDKQK